jgi:hypothetical protein
VAQITERGYPVAEVSQRLGVSPQSLAANIGGKHRHETISLQPHGLMGEVDPALAE